MAGQFEALSYASDRARCLPKLEFAELPSEKIVVGGAIVNCRQHLVQFLRKLRLNDRRRLVWCPHLCINLDDHVERNNHTRIAPLIYSSAHRVVVWFGVDSFKSPGKVFSSMCKVVNIWRKQSALLHLVGEAKYRFNPEPSPFGGPLPQKPPKPNLEEAWPAMISFFGFQSSWFRSIWSLMEIVSAKDAIVMLGDNEMPWEWVGLSSSILRENHCRLRGFWHGTWTRGREPGVSNGIVNAALMYRLCKSQSYWAPAALRLDQLFPLTAHFDWRDNHDRIYALLGIASDDHEVLSRISINYSQQVAEARYSLAKAVCDNGRLDFLARIQQDHNKRHLKSGCFDSSMLSLDGPSWCPQKAIAIHEPILPIEPHPDFNASKASLEGLRVKADGKTLSLSAVIVDQIGTESRPYRIKSFWRGLEPERRPYAPEEAPSSLRAPGSFQNLISVHELEALKELLRPGITERDLQRMAITLTCGKDWYGGPVTNIKRHTADYARSILRQGPKWSLRRAISIRNGRLPGENGSFLTVDDLLRISEGGHADRFLDAAASVGYGRASFETEKGLWGIGPEVMTKGDQLCIIQGVGVPFIIRPHIWDSHLLIGECYVYDVMHGEVAESLRAGADGFKETQVHLV